MRIAEAARRAGVSPRALRHYEDSGLLAPARTAGGYREYDESDLARAAQVRTMTAAGVGTEPDPPLPRLRGRGHPRACAPSLRAELAALDARLAGERAALAAKQDRLAALLRSGAPGPMQRACTS
ncbi:MerR family transcriptional regulator [Nocardioides sp. W3-2-3]|nr:MerR family transcriptional regulator [Nocardioides convexus]